MSLRDQAALDVQSMLNAELGDTVTLTEPDTTEHVILGKVFRVDMTIDPDTGAKIYEPATMVTISLLDLDGNLLTEEWSVSTTDSVGNVISGQVRAPQFDRTLNFVTFIIEAVN